jgi:bloom syndrome protein
MTRHNLSSHIAWLLSHEVTPRADVHAITPTSSAKPVEAENESVSGWEEEESLDIEEESLGPRDTLTTPAVNVGHAGEDFVRPPIPSVTSSSFAIPQGPLGLSRNQQELPMVRQFSAPKPARPGLVSQYQLATPASTTSTAASSSFAQTYKRFLSEENGTQYEMLSTHFGANCYRNSYTLLQSLK